MLNGWPLLKDHSNYLFFLPECASRLIYSRLSDENSLSLSLSPEFFLPHFQSAKGSFHQYSVTQARNLVDILDSVLWNQSPKPYFDSQRQMELLVKAHIISQIISSLLICLSGSYLVHLKLCSYNAASIT